MMANRLVRSRGRLQEGHPSPGSLLFDRIHGLRTEPAWRDVDGPPKRFVALWAIRRRREPQQGKGVFDLGALIEADIAHQHLRNAPAHQIFVGATSLL